MQCAVHSKICEWGRRRFVQTLQRARLTDQVVRILFFICAILLVVVIIGVIVFIGSKAFLIFGEGANVRDYFLGTFWDPTGNNGTPSYGAGGLILGSVITTVV